MAEDIKDTDGEQFKPAFVPEGSEAPEQITLPPELKKELGEYQPTEAEIDAEAEGQIHIGVSPAEERSDARSRLIKRANMSSEELAADDAARAQEGARSAELQVGPPPEAPASAESAPTELREAVDRVVPGMPEGPSDALRAAMSGENVKLENLPQSELDKFVVEKEITPEEEASLVKYSKIVIERGEAQVAGDWNRERRIREEQKAAYDALPSDKVKDIANAYASRYATDIKQKEHEAKAA
jgi:hypothetical protein